MCHTYGIFYAYHCALSRIASAIFHVKYCRVSENAHAIFRRKKITRRELETPECWQNEWQFKYQTYTIISVPPNCVGSRRKPTTSVRPVSLRCMSQAEPLTWSLSFLLEWGTRRSVSLHLFSGSHISGDKITLHTMAQALVRNAYSFFFLISCCVIDLSN